MARGRRHSGAGRRLRPLCTSSCRPRRRACRAGDPRRGRRCRHRPGVCPLLRRPQHVRARLADHTVPAQAAREPVGSELAVQQVGAVTSVEHVCHRPAANPVSSVAAIDPVGSSSGEKNVGPGAAHEPVRPGAALEEVVAAASTHDVSTTESADHVATRGPDQHLGFRSAADRACRGRRCTGSHRGYHRQCRAAQQEDRAEDVERPRAHGGSGLSRDMWDQARASGSCRPGQAGSFHLRHSGRRPGAAPGSADPGPGLVRIPWRRAPRCS